MDRKCLIIVSRQKNSLWFIFLSYAHIFLSNKHVVYKAKPKFIQVL